MRKTWLAVVLALVLVGIISTTPSPSWAQAKGPIKIGFITPLSGGMAANGKDMLAGIQLYLEEIGYQAAGRKIELLVEDDEATPATSLTKTRKLVEKDGVHVMSGGLMASTGYAIAPYIDEAQIPMTYPIMAPDDLTQRQRPKWIVRTGWTSSQPNHPLGEYAYQTLKFRKVAIIGLDEQLIFPKNDHWYCRSATGLTQECSDMCLPQPKGITWMRGLRNQLAS